MGLIPVRANIVDYKKRLSFILFVYKPSERNVDFYEPRRCTGCYS